MTNFEKIKAMSVEEMAEAINKMEDILDMPLEHCLSRDCNSCIKEWLESEAEE